MSSHAATVRLAAFIEVFRGQMPLSESRRKAGDDLRHLNRRTEKRDTMLICKHSLKRCHSERALSSRAFTRGPILKRSAGMGNVRASSPEESAPLHLRFIQSVGETRTTKMMRKIHTVCAS